MVFEQKLFELLSDESYADILRVLLQKKGATQKELAENFGFGIPILSRRLVELESVGLIGRKGSAYTVLFPDRTGALLQAAADLASDVLSRQAAEAIEHSKQLSKALNSQGGRTDVNPWE